MNALFRLLLPAAVLFAATAVVAEPVKFSDALYGKFQHQRCLQCHQFNSRSHNGRAYKSHSARYLCDNCHTLHITGLPRGEWMAPDEKLDWTGMDARKLCLLIKRNMGSGDVFNSKLADHLFNDLRVNWALDNGMTPNGRFPSLPGGSAQWARDVRAWAEDGMLCE